MNFKYINTNVYIVKMIVHKPKKNWNKLTKQALFTPEKNTALSIWNNNK